MKQILLTALFLLATLTVTAQKQQPTPSPPPPQASSPSSTKTPVLTWSTTTTPASPPLRQPPARTVSHHQSHPATITVKITDSSSAQIALLPAGRDTIFCRHIHSRHTRARLHHQILRQQLGPLPTDRHFTAPGWNDWMTPGHDITEITAHTPFMLASYFIDTDAGTLTATNNLATFLDEDTYKTLSPPSDPHSPTNGTANASQNNPSAHWPHPSHPL